MATKSWFSRFLSHKWMRTKSYLDGWFALTERVRVAIHDLFRPWQSTARARKRSFTPQIEGLEPRIVMTTVSFHTAAQNVNYDASAIWEVDLSASSGSTITVQYALIDGTASSSQDYTWTAGTLTFHPGQTSQTFTSAISDFRESIGKNFSAVLSSPTNATLGATTTDVVTIVDQPTYVVDAYSNLVLPLSDFNTGQDISSFSTWQMNLVAEDAEHAVTSYSWNFGNAPDATSISGSNTSSVHFTWRSFTGAAQTDLIYLNETNATEVITQTYIFRVNGTDSPAAVANADQYTSAGTWTATPVIAPDKLLAEDAVAAGPYTSVGLVDGSVQTGFSMPSYNPNAAPLSLEYNSAVADPQPVFMLPYPLGSPLTSFTAQLKITDLSNAAVYTGSVINYDLSALVPNDTLEVALQAPASTMSAEPSGLYNYNVVTVFNGGTPANHTGTFNFINGSTTPTSTKTSPFGAGWSLAQAEDLIKVSGTGVIIQKPDGTSLWFAGTTSFPTAAEDFSTLALTSGVYTQTFTDGTAINFTSTTYGYLQTSMVDRNGHTTTYSYNGSNQLTAVIDIDNQASTISYDGSSGLATAITDPAGRTATFSYSSGNLTAITDPAGHSWTYAYSSGELTSLKDPRSSGTDYKTSFTYSSAGQVSSVTQPDSTTQSFTPVQAVGLPSGTSATGVLAAEAFATYTDPNSQVWTEYADGLGFGLPVETIDPLIDYYELIYRDGNGLPWLTSDAQSNRDRLYFDSNGNVTEAVAADDSYSTYTYNGFAEPTQIVSGITASAVIGGTTTYAYDGNGNLTMTVDPDHDTTLFAYSGSFSGLLTATTDARGISTLYSYDADNRLTEVIEDAGSYPHLNYSTFLAYDSASNVTSTIDENGVTDSYAYDNWGDVTQAILPQTSGVSATYTYSYDVVGNELTEVDPVSSGVNATTSYAYDSMNRLTAYTDALGFSTLNAYDNNGNLTAVTDTLGNTTTYGYDNASRLIEEVDPIDGGTSATTLYSLNADGTVEAMTDPLGKVTYYTYDTRGRLTSISDPFNYGYDALGDETSVTQTDAYANAVTSTMAYDKAGLVTQSVDAMNFTTLNSYDADHDLTHVVGYGQTADYTYDALGRVTAQKTDGVSSTTFSYDPVGNMTQTTDLAGNVERYTYDDQGRVLTAGNANGTTTYAYNLAGWQTSIVDPDHNTTKYAYDIDGRMTQTISPTNHTATFAYDHSGNLTSTVDYDNHTINYAYDEAGWLTSETWVGGGYSASYAYDLKGELTAAADSNSTYAFQYDSLGNETQAQVSYAGASGMGTVTLDYEYQFFHERTKLTDSEGGTTTYGYNDNGQLSSLDFRGSSAELSVGISYDATYDQASAVAFGDGNGADALTENIAYSPYSSALSYDAGVSTYASFSQNLNDAGQVTSSVGPEGSLTYQYDGGGQLTLVTNTANASTVYSYSFDANGNPNGAGYTIPANSGNQISTDPAGDTLTYDNNGNLHTKTDASSNVWTYTWDYRNRLTEVVEKNSGNTTVVDEQFTYDIFGNLIGDDVITSPNGSSNRWTVFDGSNPYMDFNGSGSLTMHYLSNPQTQNQFFGRVDSSGNVGFYLTDQNGSIREIMGAAHANLDQINYDPFGKVTETTPANGDRLKFQGGQYDDNTFLTLFGARWQDAASGRWISEDPIGFSAGDSNLYRYVNNAPTNGTDPSGLSDDYMNWVRGGQIGPPPKMSLPVPPVPQDSTGGQTGTSIYQPPPPPPPVGPGPSQNAASAMYQPPPPAPVGPGPNQASVSAMAPRPNAPVDYPALPLRFYLWDGPIAFLQGLFGTGGKAVLNSAYKTTVNVATLGMANPGNLVEPTVDDVAIGYNFAAFLGDVGTNILAMALLIRFGNNPNQSYHTFRHVVTAGMDPAVVEAAVQADLAANAGIINSGLNVRSITVGGQQITYSAFKLPDGVINVGRITVP